MYNSYILHLLYKFYEQRIKVKDQTLKEKYKNW